MKKNEKFIQTEPVLSTGEKVALAAGKLIVTEVQMALCFITAKEQLEEGKYYLGTGIDKTQLYIECGMNQKTFRRCVEKFKILLNGQEEDEEVTDKEVIYKKLKTYFIKFMNMKTDDVLELAKQSLTPENREKGQQVYNNRQLGIDNSLEKTKQLKKNIKYKTLQLFNQLKKSFDIKKAYDMTIAKIALEMNIDKSVVKANTDIKI
jgi:hypothetical protein